MIVTAPPGVRSATSCGYRAAVAWNASHIVAGKPGSAIAASPSYYGAAGHPRRAGRGGLRRGRPGRHPEYALIVLPRPGRANNPGPVLALDQAVPPALMRTACRRAPSAVGALRAVNPLPGGVEDIRLS